MCTFEEGTLHDISPNLVPRAFLRLGEGERKKKLASPDHVIFKHPEKLGVINVF